MTKEELLNTETQTKVIHPMHGKCRLVSVASTIANKVVGVLLITDSDPSKWVQITDYENLTQVAWEHDPDGK